MSKLSIEMENITGMSNEEFVELRKTAKEIYGDYEQRAWDEHKDICNGCALCEL